MKTLKNIKTIDEFLNEDLIPGGKGDITKPSDVDQNELKVGIEVEKEHVGQNTQMATEIALDHLTEDPKYYSKLVKSGIVDEPEALKLAKELLGIESKEEKDIVESFSQFKKEN